MFYARWSKDQEMKNILKKIDFNQEITSSGTPITYEKNNLYVTSRDAHSLIIGGAGSGKTQAIILPETKLSLLAGESVVINDIKGEIYEQTAYNFKEKGYNVLALNFDNPDYGSSWNPLA